MRRINSPQRGEGARRSGATSSDDNEAVANLDKQNALIICAQFLNNTRTKNICHTGKTMIYFLYHHLCYDDSQKRKERRSQGTSEQRFPFSA